MSDGDGGAGEDKEGEDRSGGGWVTSGVMVMEVPGKLKRGRQKRRWLGNIRSDGDGGAGEDKEGKTEAGGGWVTS